ncbi:hypothetical protein FACS1894133_4280 [Clostridia bacterium]|nr:hypothetical protein FACS1894133_4280 [Clostridia bacterium]
MGNQVIDINYKMSEDDAIGYIKMTNAVEGMYVTAEEEADLRRLMRGEVTVESLVAKTVRAALAVADSQ